MAAVRAAGTRRPRRPLTLRGWKRLWERKKKISRGGKEGGNFPRESVARRACCIQRTLPVGWAGCFEEASNESREASWVQGGRNRCPTNLSLWNFFTFNGICSQCLINPQENVPPFTHCKGRGVVSETSSARWECRGRKSCKSTTARFPILIVNYARNCT